ncbi:MAG: autotransporter outer membrane beta-barrel domain-containing protein [Gallionella sp.]|nr:autotransporter outer membrane beta-barrel domain-containing protein [Gallionella sp.]
MKKSHPSDPPSLQRKLFMNQHSHSQLSIISRTVLRTIIFSALLISTNATAATTPYITGGSITTTSPTLANLSGANISASHLVGNVAIAGGLINSSGGNISIGTISNSGGNLTISNAGSIGLTGSTSDIVNIGIIANTGSINPAFNPSSPPSQSIILLPTEQLASVNSLISSGLNFVLFGSHHRTLLDNGLTQTGTGVWVTGDVARHDPNNSNASIGELGIYKDMTPSLRLGVGTGINQARQGMPVGGSGKLDANYLVLEGAYQPMNSNWSGSTTVYLGSNRAMISRGYMVGAVANLSIGHTNGSAWAMRLRSDWHNVATLGQFEASPYFSYTHGESRLNGYTEIGGTFPVTYTSQKQTSDELRGGVTLLSKLSEQTDLRFPMEIAYRSNNGGLISGEVLARQFSVNTPRTNQSWGRTGVELDHRIDKQTVLNGGVLFSSQGGDSSWLCTFSLKHAF